MYTVCTANRTVVTRVHIAFVTWHDCKRLSAAAAVELPLVSLRWAIYCSAVWTETNKLWEAKLMCNRLKLHRGHLCGGNMPFSIKLLKIRIIASFEQNDTGQDINLVSKLWSVFFPQCCTNWIMMKTFCNEKLYNISFNIIIIRSLYGGRWDEEGSEAFLKAAQIFAKVRVFNWAWLTWETQSGWTVGSLRRWSSGQCPAGPGPSCHWTCHSGFCTTTGIQVKYCTARAYSNIQSGMFHSSTHQR